MDGIHLLDDFYAEWDGTCWILRQIYVIQTGKRAGQEAVKTLGYFGQLDNLLRHIAREHAYSNAKTLEEYFLAFYKARDAIKKLVPQLVEQESKT